MKKNMKNRKTIKTTKNIKRFKPKNQKPNLSQLWLYGTVVSHRFNGVCNG